MFQNFADDLDIGNEADYPHLAATLRTDYEVNFPHLFGAFPPLGEANIF